MNPIHLVSVLLCPLLVNDVGSANSHRWQEDMAVLVAFERAGGENPPPKELYERLAHWLREHPDDPETLYQAAVAHILGRAELFDSNRTLAAAMHRAADRGHSRAQAVFAASVMSTGNEAFMAMGRDMLRLSIAAGCSLGKATYGEVLWHGRGVPQDRQRAVQFLEEAVVAGEPAAMHYLGRILRHGAPDLPPRRDRGLELIERSALLSYAPAARELCVMYLEGLDVPISYDQAIRWGRRAMELGRPGEIAQHLALALHSATYDREADRRAARDEARELLQGLAERGAADAARLLALWSAGHAGGDPDLHAALRWLHVAAELQCVASMTDLAMMYAAGVGVARDPAKAEAYMRALVLRHAVDPAISRIWLQLDDAAGRGLLREPVHHAGNLPPADAPWRLPAEQHPQDIAVLATWLDTVQPTVPHEAIQNMREWVRRFPHDAQTLVIAAALQERGCAFLFESEAALVSALEQARSLGDRRATSELALYLVRRPTLDPARAIELAEESAASGCAAGKLALAHLRWRGTEQQPPDQARTRELLRQAVTAGFPPAVNLEAELMVTGREGFPRDIVRGLEILEQAAARGDNGAIRALVSIYMRDCRWLPKPERERLAFHWARRGIEIEDPYLIRLAAECLHRGTGTPANEDQAWELLRRAADLGDGPATHMLALAEFSRAMVRDSGDLSEGLRLLHRASDLGDATAMLELGLFYHAGIAVEQDAARGRALLAASARRTPVTPSIVPYILALVERR